MTPNLREASPKVEDGVTSVVEAGLRFKLVAENELEGYTLSSPAVAEGQIFVRTEKYLYCIGERRPKAHPG